ncbi:hypothetical protein Q5P01_009056 [Channa striata]|uniref:SUMO-interacting motif-containing protein 1 n=1 Tax=Channa striata TaxID=64152 RepID=A0AA88N0R0_CHASR|nr:hypothetical protein Q5P01_009056 [Channa striata]
MADVITVSSDDSDVEIVGIYNNVMTKSDPLPLSDVRVDVNVVNANVPPRYIDLTDPRWTLPALKIRKRQSSTALAVVDLTESDLNKPAEEIETFPPDYEIKKEINKNQTLNIHDFDLQKPYSGDASIFSPQQDCGKQTKNAHACHHTPAVKLRRLAFLETHYKELETSMCSVYLTKNCEQMSLCLRQLDDNSKTPECIRNLSLTSSSGPHMEQLKDESPHQLNHLQTNQEQQKNNDFENAQPHDNVFSAPKEPTQTEALGSDTEVSVATLNEHRTCECKTSPSSQDKVQGSIQREILSLNVEQQELDKGESRQSPCDYSCPSSTIVPNSNDFESHSPSSPVLPDNSQVNPTSSPEKTNEQQLEQVVADRASESSDFLGRSIPTEHPLSPSKMENIDEESGNGAYRGDLGIDSPVSFPWPEESDEDVIEDSRYDINFRAASAEDRHFVCPVTLRKMMSGPPQALIGTEEEGFGAPEVLCRQSLSLVYSTIDESYTEGTLQLLSDLLQPGYYPPKDITTHLLHGILLDPQCPHHLCVQAFNLLMRTQRHHMVDKTTVPWHWELLTSVMSNQDHGNKLRSEIVRMLLEYVVQTLEDDFQAKRPISALQNSIAKATLSCDQQFNQVRDVIKWLFAAIMKSTDCGESKETKERDEQIRMVCIFQRMLSLALEVDRSPALSSAKLSQELFHMLISNMPLRAHRMLLLESMQSKLLRCKLLEHLLDYTCPLKIPLPMSLSLLLHFLKNCTLAPDPMDGTERWQKWEELVHLLWMLLLSYNKAMKGYLCSSVTEQSGRVGMVGFVYKPDDKVSRPAICEAVEAFLSRSKDDLGQALPLHVEESLTYLQDYLLDVCQC